MNKEKVRVFLIELGERICNTVRDMLLELPVDVRTRVTRSSISDDIYDLDERVEKIVVESMKAVSSELDIALIAEGIGQQELTVYPEGKSAEEVSIRIIMDPIDGTRGIMYDKRSAFFLAGAAPNRGEETRLQDIEVSVMVEVPTTRAYLADTLSAIRGEGIQGYSRNLFTHEKKSFVPKPHAGESIKGGFAQISRFFPPGRDKLAAIEEALIATLFPDAEPGVILTFEDQYISTGGQLYELLTGKDRFTADIRGALYRVTEQQGDRIGHVCHPYDLAAHMMAEEVGLVVTNPDGTPLDAPMITTVAADWVGYANERIRGEVEPVLQKILARHGFF